MKIKRVNLGKGNNVDALSNQFYQKNTIFVLEIDEKITYLQVYEVMVTQNDSIRYKLNDISYYNRLENISDLKDNVINKEIRLAEEEECKQARKESGWM